MIELFLLIIVAIIAFSELAIEVYASQQQELDRINSITR